MLQPGAMNFTACRYDFYTLPLCLLKAAALIVTAYRYAE
jgi:hypothetical protein